MKYTAERLVRERADFAEEARADLDLLLLARAVDAQDSATLFEYLSEHLLAYVHAAQDEDQDALFPAQRDPLTESRRQDAERHNALIRQRLGLK